MARVLVTGANRGVGLALCGQLAKRGDAVIAVCRSAGAELDTLQGEVEIVDGIDVARAENVDALATRVKDQTLDVVLHNAGILRSDHFNSLDYDAMLEQFVVNTLGPLRVVRALSGNLREGSKVGIVSSRVGSIEDNGSGNNYGYRVSKAGVNMVGKNLSHDLRDRGIAVVLLHPGLVATQMTGGRGITAAEAAAGIIERMDDLSMATSGSFWHAEGYELPW